MTGACRRMNEAPRPIESSSALPDGSPFNITISPIEISSETSSLKQEEPQTTTGRSVTTTDTFSIKFDRLLLGTTTEPYLFKDMEELYNELTENNKTNDSANLTVVNYKQNEFKPSRLHWD